MNILTRLWIHNQDYEYYACSVHLLCIQLVTKHYTCGFPAPGCKCDCTLSFWVHMWISCLGNASQLYANKPYLNTAWRPREMTVFQNMTLLRDFTAKSTHSPAVFTLWVFIPIHLRVPLSHPFCSHWANLPRTLLEVASQIVWHIHAIVAWWVMQTLEVWADTKSCETYHVFSKTSLFILSYIVCLHYPYI